MLAAVYIVPSILRPTLRPVLTPPLRRTLTPIKGVGGPQATLSRLAAFLAANDGALNPHSQGDYSPSPTVTVSVGTAGAPSAPYTGLSSLYTYTGAASQLRYWGGGNKAYSAGGLPTRRFPSSYSAPAAGNVGDNENAATWRVPVRHTGQSIAYRIDSGDSVVFATWRLIVDGKYVSVAEPTLPGGGRRWLVFDFGSVAARDVTLEGVAAAFFWGVAVAAGDTIEAVAL